MNRRNVRRLAQGILLIIILGFWGQALAQNWQAFTTYPWRIAWGPIVAAFVVRLIQMPLAATIWWRALALSGAQIPYRAGLALFLQTQIGRYLPGGVWDLVGRFVLGQQAGVSRRSMAASIGLEMGLQVVTGGVYLLAALALRTGVDVRVYGVLGGLVTVGTLAVLAPPVFTRLVNWGLALLRRPPLRMHLTYGDLLLLFLGRLLAHGMLGVGFYLFALGITEIPIRLAPLLICGYVGAWLVGYLAVLAPMGIGVREGAFVLLAGNQVLFAVATAATVGYRALITLRDLLAAGIGVWLQRRVDSRLPVNK